MGKSSLQLSKPMTDTTFQSEKEAVDKAAVWAEALLTKAHRGPGDSVEAAMYRAEAMFGIPQTLFWALRYRRPKIIGVATAQRLYQAFCAAQEAKLRNELETTKQLPATPAPLALIRETEALVGPATSEPDGPA